MACASGAADAPASSGGSSVSCRFLLRSSLRISISLGAAAGKGSSYHSLSETLDMSVLLLGRIYIHRRTYGRIAVRNTAEGGAAVMHNLSPRHTPVNTLCTFCRRNICASVRSWCIDMVGIDGRQRTSQRSRRRFELH